MSDNPTPDESQIKLFNASVSMRGVIALILVITLCAGAMIYPTSFEKIFESAATAIVFFYFGQATKK